MKRLDFINKRLSKKMRQGHTSNVDEAMFEYYPVVAKQIIIHQRLKKMVNYYLL